MHPLPLCRAGVRAGGTLTDYLCAGTGPPVILLTAAHCRRAARLRLLLVLARGCRSYAPQLPGSDPKDFPVWLAGFLDGLGLGAVGLVVTWQLAPTAMAHARLYPWQVRRLALIRAPRIGVGGAGPAGWLELPHQPLLVLPMRSGDASTAATLLNFLNPDCPLIAPPRR